MRPEKNQPLTLIDEKGRKYLVFPGLGMKEIKGLGVVDTDRLSGAPIGSRLEIAGEGYLISKTSLIDVLDNIQRGPQLITLKDAAQILVGCGIAPGDRVLEVGSGTGAMTIVLAYYVGTGGRVVSYERNPKAFKITRQNLKQAGLDGIVEMRPGDAAECDEVEEYDAVVTDTPEPWGILGPVTKALKPSRFLCSYVPTVNQAEKAVLSMRDAGYDETRVVENLQREMVVGKGGTRPSFDMLGHTGYLCFGRNMGP